MTAKFVQDRITQLRLQKGVSEYKMSYDLGHSRGYINNISSGKALPSLAELFAICDYFHITVNEFFGTCENPPLQNELARDIAKLSAADLELLQSVVRRLLTSV
ncbi:MAG: helix-turn-helix transcriptional regulator [Clostridia bacterium]|nr:helix-turn-helix transcriptional regulator [Clostridia bacterium]